MKTKRKVVLKQLKKFAESLPEDTYKAYHKYFTPKWEEDENGEEVLRLGYLQDHPVNHGRRLKKMYDLFGMLGVQGYLHSYGYQLTDKAAA